MWIQATVKTMTRFAAAFVLMLLVGSPALAQFESDNVSLHARLSLNDLGGAANGNDCWGYTSPSGREYALMGISNGMVVVEVTNPGSPVIVGAVSHANSLRGDMKTYGYYVYVVNASGGGGMDVVDLSDVDNGTVTLIQRVTAGGLNTSHNVAIDTDSGYLYVVGSNLNGGRLVAYDLSDPEDPTFAGEVASGVGTYVHDAQIVTFDSGPYDGKQIAFCANGGTGLDIYDVTTKSSMFRLSRTTYSHLSYAHQCWLSEDRQLLYLNDELDGVNETVIFDVSDLSDPVVIGAYDSGSSAGDHNLYVHNGFIFEAEYHAGMRVFCAEDPFNPVQVGWFDTYPENDNGGFDGAWSVYPFFASGTVIISDIDRGLFIVDPSAALEVGTLNFDYPEGRPMLIDPPGGTRMRIAVTGVCGATVAAGTGLLHYDSGDGFVSILLEDVSDGVFDAVFPAVDCLQTVSYYLSMETTGGVTKVDPPGAPATTFEAVAATNLLTFFEDDFEGNQGWSVANGGGLGDGAWTRGFPVDCNRGDPPNDSDGSGQCYLTDNSSADFCNSDVDDGSTTLTSPVMDASQPGTAISYYRWYSNTEGDGPMQDIFVVQVSDDGGASWVSLETVGPSDSEVNGGWFHKEFFLAGVAGLELTDQFRIRFTASDTNPQSIVEAGVDHVRLFAFECDDLCPADLSGDGDVDAEDLAMLLGAWGPNPGHPADLDGNGDIGPFDLALLLGVWGPCP